LEHNICVLIDFENIAAGTEREGLGRFDIKAVMRRLKDKGRILSSRAYGDWGRFAKYKQGLLEAGVTMVELTSYRGAEKNRADIALVVDAMEWAFTREHFDTFVLLSGDSDFTPLVQRLKEMNKRVIGIGTRGSTSRLIIAMCDEFIFYKSLKKTTDQRGDRERIAKPNESTDDKVEAIGKDEAFALLAETLEGLQREEPGSVLAGLIKQSMQRKAPHFDEHDLGFSGFARFLETARNKGLVSLSRDPRAGGYRVDLPGEMASNEEPREERKDVLPPLEGNAEVLREILINNGINPTDALHRHCVVHELVDHVNERIARKRRNTFMYVFGDIARRCRKTEPVVSSQHVRDIITTLKDMGMMLHSDGDPIRSNTANFVFNRDAEGLLEALRVHYIRNLIQQKAPIDDSKALSVLLWGDTDHNQVAEELVAWTQHEVENETPEDTTASQAPVDSQTSSEAKGGKDQEPAPSADDEGAQSSAKADATGEKSTPKTVRKTTTKAAKDASPDVDDGETSESTSAEPAEEAPKKRTRKTAKSSTTKAASSKKAASAKTKTKAASKDESVEPAAEATEEPAPKKKTVLRRKAAKKPDEAVT